MIISQILETLAYSINQNWLSQYNEIASSVLVSNVCPK